MKRLRNPCMHAMMTAQTKGNMKQPTNQWTAVVNQLYQNQKQQYNQYKVQNEQIYQHNIRSYTTTKKRTMMKGKRNMDRHRQHEHQNNMDNAMNKKTVQKIHGMFTEKQQIRTYTVQDQKEKKDMDVEEAFAPLSNIYFEGKSEMLDDLNALYQEASTRMRAQQEKQQEQQQDQIIYDKKNINPIKTPKTKSQLTGAVPSATCTGEKTIRIKIDVYEPDYVELPVVGSLNDTLESARVALGIDHGDVLVNVATEAVVCHENDIQESALYLLETKEAFEDYHEQITPRKASLKNPSKKRTILWFSNKAH